MTEMWVVNFYFDCGSSDMLSAGHWVDVLGFASSAQPTALIFNEVYSRNQFYTQPS